MAELPLKASPGNRQGRHIRSAIHAWFEAEGLPEQTEADAELIATELLSNAIAASPIDAEIEIRLVSDDTGVLVETVNSGPGFDPRVLKRVADDHLGGRGIAIASALGTVSVLQKGDRTTVRVFLPFIG